MRIKYAVFLFVQRFLDQNTTANVLILIKYLIHYARTLVVIEFVHTCVLVNLYYYSLAAHSLDINLFPLRIGINYLCQYVEKNVRIYTHTHTYTHILCVVIQMYFVLYDKI